MLSNPAGRIGPRPDPQDLRMLLGAFRGGNPLERIVGKSWKWLSSDYYQEVGECLRMCPLLRYSAYRELNRALLRCAFHRFANCDQEDGSHAGRMRRKEVDHVAIKKGQPGRT